MKQIEKISKMIFDMRCTLGYATKQQRKEGWKQEMKTVKMMVRDAPLNGTASTGGFIYQRLKSGSVRITPNFSWIVRKKK